MSDPVVVDASLATKWLVDEVQSELAYALAHSWVEAGTQPVAPCLMPIEVANALHRRVLRGERSPNEATELLDALVGSGIDLMEPPQIHTTALGLARQLGQDAVYDSHYLALAEAIDAELWRADQRFQQAAASGQYGRVRWLGEFARRV